MFKKSWLRPFFELGKLVDFNQCLADLKLKQPDQEFEQPLIH